MEDCSKLPFGIFRNELDTTDLLLLREGGDYPFGYRPAYRDEDTFLCVLKRFVPLSPPEEAEAREHEASDLSIAFHKEWVSGRFVTIGECLARFVRSMVQSDRALN